MSDTDWHRWFAWFPVNVSDNMPEPVWLKTVERKRVNYPDGYWFWTYRRAR